MNTWLDAISCNLGYVLKVKFLIFTLSYIATKHVLKVYCQINLLTHINTLIVRDVTLNKISLVHFHD